MPYKDNADRIAQKRRWYAKNLETHVASYGAKKKWLHEYKADKGCSKCGESDPYCLDLHHTDPSTKASKTKSPIQMSWDGMKSEVAICIVMCANCHRKEHHGDNGGGRPRRAA